MSTQTNDTGKVHMGGTSPSLPRPTSDTGKVRLGGTSPSLPRAK
jgi:hypothetical protein